MSTKVLIGARPGCHRKTMPPIRRYVRISPYSCLEVRIFLDNPADITTWLLRPSNPALPRVFSAVKPLILPKLREENERTRLAKGKGGKKKKGVKDVVKGDDFEVVVFLTEGHGRHEVVVKRKEAREMSEKPGGIGGKKDNPMFIGEDDEEDDVMDLNDIPAAQNDDESEGENFHPDDQFQDEKKKLGFKTNYDGFSIWGKVLCLLVERKGGTTRKTAKSLLKPGSLLAEEMASDEGAQQALMQEWISSTQLPVDEDDIE